MVKGKVILKPANEKSVELVPDKRRAAKAPANIEVN